MVAIKSLDALLVLAVVSSCSGSRIQHPKGGPLMGRPMMVGGSKDLHGCLTSAGYQWCESKAKCMRHFQEACPATVAKEPEVIIEQTLAPEVPMTGTLTRCFSMGDDVIRTRGAPPAGYEYNGPACMKELGWGSPAPSPALQPEPKMCCMMMTATCEACKKGMSVEAFCKKNPGATGCEGASTKGDDIHFDKPIQITQPEPKMCCMMMHAKCEACKKGMSVEAFCKKNPGANGCEGASNKGEISFGGKEEVPGFCSYPMWSIPEVGTVTRCDHDGGCPKRAEGECNDIFGRAAGETCKVSCATGLGATEEWKCGTDSTWSLVGPSLQCGSSAEPVGFCSYPQWSIPGTGTDTRCDHDDGCPMRPEKKCDDIYGVMGGETCKVTCASRPEVSEEWKCGQETWTLVGHAAECPKLTPAQPHVIGGSKDDHGCLLSAGYQWCEAKKTCLRPHEEKCEEKEQQPAPVEQPVSAPAGPACHTFGAMKCKITKGCRCDGAWDSIWEFLGCGTEGCQASN